MMFDGGGYFATGVTDQWLCSGVHGMSQMGGKPPKAECWERAG
jgi:hypothetical protein